MAKLRGKTLETLEFYLVRLAILVLTAISLARLIAHELKYFFPLE